MEQPPRDRNLSSRDDFKLLPLLRLQTYAAPFSDPDAKFDFLVGYRVSSQADIDIAELESISLSYIYHLRESVVKRDEKTLLLLLPMLSSFIKGSWLLFWSFQFAFWRNSAEDSRLLSELRLLKLRNDSGVSVAVSDFFQQIQMHFIVQLWFRIDESGIADSILSVLAHQTAFSLSMRMVAAAGLCQDRHGFRFPLYNPRTCFRPSPWKKHLDVSDSFLELWHRQFQDLESIHPFFGLTVQYLRSTEQSEKERYRTEIIRNQDQRHVCDGSLGITPLHLAMADPDLSCVFANFCSAEELRVKDAFGCCPLYYAVQWPATLERLLVAYCERLGSLHLYSDFLAHNLLMFAFQCASPQSVSLLCQHWPDAHLLHGPGARSVLHYASTSSEYDAPQLEECTRHLLARVRESDKNRLLAQPSWEGLNPLHVAASLGHHQIVQLFLQHGADPHSLTLRTEQTAHELASSGFFFEVCKLLGDTQSPVNFPAWYTELEKRVQALYPLTLNHPRSRLSLLEASAVCITATEIARGAYGIVYRAFMNSNGHLVAAKLPMPDAHALDLFLNEVALFTVAMANGFPCTVKLLGVVDASGQPALIMEFIDGTNLLDWKPSDCGLSDLLDMAHSLSVCFGEMESYSLRHGDIADRNILIRHRSPPSAVIIDLGLATVPIDALPRVVRDSHRVERDPAVQSLYTEEDSRSRSDLEEFNRLLTRMFRKAKISDVSLIPTVFSFSSFMEAVNFFRNLRTRLLSEVRNAHDRLSENARDAYEQPLGESAGKSRDQPLDESQMDSHPLTEPVADSDYASEFKKLTHQFNDFLSLSAAKHQYDDVRQRLSTCQMCKDGGPEGIHRLEDSFQVPKWTTLQEDLVSVKHLVCSECFSDHGNFERIMSDVMWSLHHRGTVSLSTKQQFFLYGGAILSCLRLFCGVHLIAATNYWVNTLRDRLRNWRIGRCSTAPKLFLYAHRHSSDILVPGISPILQIDYWKRNWCASSASALCVHYGSLSPEVSLTILVLTESCAELCRTRYHPNACGAKNSRTTQTCPRRRLQSLQKLRTAACCHCASRASHRSFP